MSKLVFVFDPTDEQPHHIPNGKQTRNPSHTWYTPCTGIWQTVWLESAPPTYITSMDIAADMDGRSKPATLETSTSTTATLVYPTKQSLVPSTALLTNRIPLRSPFLMKAVPPLPPTTPSQTSHSPLQFPHQSSGPLTASTRSK